MWLENKAEELNRGFEWRSGSKRHTQGFWVWSEPFIIETSHRGKVSAIVPFEV